MALNHSTQEVSNLLLEKLKANGTFDELRRFCLSDIDTKPTYQNWKQQIESSAFKFLSKVEYTPELNKNIIWEKMRRLFEGHETQEISDGADRILNQLLSPKILDAFEPKILKVVNEYLENENETAPSEISGLNESTTSLKNVSKNQINTSFKPQTDLVSSIENMGDIEETSPEFEPLDSFLDYENSHDKIISGMSGLVSVFSPVQIVSKEKNYFNFNGFDTNTNLVENLQLTYFNQNGNINHENKSTNNESYRTNFISNNSEKPKTNDFRSKSKHHSSKISGHTNSKDKSSSNKSKNRNSNSHHSTSGEKNDIKKRSNSNSKNRKNSSNTNHCSNFKNKDKISHQTDCDKTPKRVRKDSMSDKKEKSSNPRKEPKSLDGNRRDDESNVGGSSEQKIRINKNKSSTPEKSKLSSSNYKSNQKDNSSEEVVSKSKNKSSISSNSHSSSQQLNNQTNKKKHKHDLEEESNNPNVVEKQIMTINQDSSKMLDEKEAAETMLSMGLTTFVISQNKKEVKTNNTEINLISDANQMTSKHDSSTTSTVPKPNLLDAIKKKIYDEKKETNNKKSLVSSIEGDVLVIDDTSKTVPHEQNDKQSNCNTVGKINDSSITSTNTLHKGYDNLNTQTLNIETSFNDFKGFSSTNSFCFEILDKLLSITNIVEEEKTHQSEINEDICKGFDNNTSTLYKHQHIVYAQSMKEIVKSIGFKGFTEDVVRKSDGYESVKNKLEQMIQENQQKTIIHGGNGIQSEKAIDKVIVIKNKSKNDNDTTQNENYSQPNEGLKKIVP